MRTALFVRCLLVVLLMAAVADAQQADSARLAAAIAPFVDDQTLVVAHVDLRSVDTQAGADKLIDALRPTKDAAENLKASATALGQRLDLLKQQGANDLFGLINIADFPAGPLTLVIPVGRDADTAKIVEAVQINFLGAAAKGARFGESLVIAMPKTLERIRAKQNQKARPEIAEAFQAVGDTSAQLLFVPSAQTRRVVEEMLPTLPAPAGGGSIKPFTSGLRWVAAGATIPPKPISLKVIAQAADAQSATALSHEVVSLTAALARQPMVKGMIPKFDELAKYFVPTVQGDRLTLDWNDANGGLKAIVAILGPPVEEMRGAASAARSMNNLKQFGLAMHNYHDSQKSFPPRAILSKEGKPLLSWRVAILPHLDEDKRYKEFHLDEPWDSEHNRRLIDRMPEVLRSPNSSAASGRTTYLAPVMPGAIFGGSEGMPIKQITDGTSQTILLVEADDDHAVVWTKPEDIEIDLDNPSKGLLVGSQQALFSLFADGSAHRWTTPAELAPAQLKVRITASGGEPVPR
jgi:hypothetical protein